MCGKDWASMAIDFFITAGTTYLSWPADTDITLRMLITLLVGSAVAVVKGAQTYRATHPGKIEVVKR